jgi:hypothetical protein
MDDEEEGEESEDRDDELENERTRIDVSIGNLQISVENHDREACEEQFYRVYEYVMDDVDDWSKAMSDVLTKNGGFQ